MPLPDESKAQKAKDLIARFQNNINSTPEAAAPLRVRHSFGSNEVLSEPSTSRDPSPGNSRRPSEVDSAPKQVKSPFLHDGRRLSGAAEASNTTFEPSQPSAKAVGAGLDPATAQSLSAYSIVVPPAGSAKDAPQTAATPGKIVAGPKDIDNSRNAPPATVESRPAPHSQEPTPLRASTLKKHDAQIAAAKASPTVKTPARTTSAAPLSPNNPISPLAKAKPAKAATSQPTSAARPRQQVSESSSKTPLKSPAPQRKVVSPSPPAVKAASSGMSRLMRPTAASASRSRASLGGEGASPQQHLSSSVRATGPRASVTSPTQDQAARTRKLSTPGSTRSSLSASVRQTSRDSPTKIAKSPLLPHNTAGSNVAGPSTPAKTPTSPTSLSASQSRLMKPTVSSLAHVRGPEEHHTPTARVPSGSAATPPSARGPSTKGVSGSGSATSNKTIGARVPSTRGIAGSPLNGIKPKVGIKSASPGPPKRLLLADKSDAAASPTRTVHPVVEAAPEPVPVEEPLQASVEPTLVEEDRPDVNAIPDIDAQDGPASPSTESQEMTTHDQVQPAAAQQAVQSDASVPALSSAPTSASSTSGSMPQDVHNQPVALEAPAECVTESMAELAVSPKSADPATEDFAAKWGNGSAEQPLPSPSVVNAVSPSAGEGKKTPIWMRQGGETSA